MLFGKLLITTLFFILVGGNVVGLDSLIWLLGSAVWMLLCKYYIVPRRIGLSTDKQLPDFIGKKYGVGAKVIVSFCVGVYYILLLNKVIGRFLILVRLAWDVWGFVEVSLSLIFLLLLCVIFLYFRKSPHLLFFAGSIFLLFLLLAPLLLGKEGFYLNVTNITSSVSRENNSINKILLLLVGVFLGHPTFSSILLQIEDDHKLKSILNWGSLSLIGLWVINSGIFSHAINIIDNDSLRQSSWYSTFILFHILYESFILFGLCNILLDHLVNNCLSNIVEVRFSKYFNLIGICLLLVGLFYLSFWETKLHIKIVEVTSMILMSIQFNFIVILIGVVPILLSFYSVLLSVPTLQLLIYFIPILKDFRWGILLALNFFFFLITHYGKKIVFVKRNWWDRRRISKEAISFNSFKSLVRKIKNMPNYILNYPQYEIEEFGAKPVWLGACFIISYWLGLFLMPFKNSEAEFLFYTFVAIAYFMSVVLILYPLLPKIFYPYLASYWIGCLCYILTILPIIGYILSEGSLFSLFHLLFSIVILSFLLTNRTFLITQSVGVTMALFFTTFNKTQISFESWKVLIFGYGGMSLCLLISKNISEVGQQGVMVKLKRFSRKVLGDVSNSLAVTKSHASIMELCMKSMTVNSEGEEIVLKMQKNNYHLFKKQIDQLIAESDISRERLKESFASLKNPEPFERFSKNKATFCVEEAVNTWRRIYQLEKSPEVIVKKDFVFFGFARNIVSSIIEIFENARYFSGCDGNIDIVIDSPNIIISNSESNLELEQLPYIFTKFYTKDKKELGIGLYFVAKVMRACGGRVEAISSGSKTSFVLIFPKK